MNDLEMPRDLPADELSHLNTSFRTAFEASLELLSRLEASSLKRGEQKVLRTARRVYTKGLLSVLNSRRKKEAKDELIGLARRFCAQGPASALSVGTQRGGDFLLNQIRGQWAESVCCSIDWVGHRIVPFGPSGAAMPGEEDHEQVVRAFRLIALLEGKRPDLLAFQESNWNTLGGKQREAVHEWPTRVLNADEESILTACRCGIEVKNSTWHYERRRSAMGRPLAVTVKEEELHDINAWSERLHKPVLFLQVLFDEVYCMSFRRMLDAIKRGYLYDDGDYNDQRDRKSQKRVHRFFLQGNRHLCAKVTFPSDSRAIIQVLPNGNVIPYIRYSPVGSSGFCREVIERELNYDET